MQFFWGCFLGGGAGGLCINCCRWETSPAQDGAPPPPPSPGSGLRSLPSSLAAWFHAKKQRRKFLLSLGPDPAHASAVGTAKALPKSATGPGMRPSAPQPLLCSRAGAPGGAELWEEVEDSCASLLAAVVGKGVGKGYKKGIKIRFREVVLWRAFPGNARVSASSPGVQGGDAAIAPEEALSPDPSPNQHPPSVPPHQSRTQRRARSSPGAGRDGFRAGCCQRGITCRMRRPVLCSLRSLPGRRRRGGICSPRRSQGRRSAHGVVQGSWAHRSQEHPSFSIFWQQSCPRCSDLGAPL